MIRDAIGSASDPNARQECLALLREKLAQIYEGRLRLPDPASRSPEDHVIRAVAMSVHRYEIPAQHFAELADACLADASVARYPTWERLAQHGRRLGGSAAAIVACVLGVTRSDALTIISTLGCAIWFTNVLHRIRADAGRERIYLPLEDLARFRYAERDLLAGAVNENVWELMRFEVDRARQMYREGAEMIAWLAGDGSRLAAATALVAHAATLDAIERDGYNVPGPSEKPRSSQQVRSLLRLPRAIRLARRLPGEPLPPFV
jgi:phytoene synthase